MMVFMTLKVSNESLVFIAFKFQGIYFRCLPATPLTIPIAILLAIILAVVIPVAILLFIPLAIPLAILLTIPPDSWLELSAHFSWTGMLL